MKQLGVARVLEEQHIFNTPASPHVAAEIDGKRVNESELTLPQLSSHDTLLIEGAGGLMVPINRDCLYIDVFKQWQLPVILCARTALGTINHTLLSVSALQERKIPILGIAFIGDEMSDTEKTICDFTGVKKLGRLPLLNTINQETLSQAFEDHFRRKDFQ